MKRHVHIMSTATRYIVENWYFILFSILENLKTWNRRYLNYRLLANTVRLKYLYSSTSRTLQCNGAIHLSFSSTIAASAWRSASVWNCTFTESSLRGEEDLGGPRIWDVKRWRLALRSWELECYLLVNDEFDIVGRREVTGEVRLGFW